MLTADGFYAIKKDTGHIPKSVKNKKIKHNIVSNTALAAVLGVIESETGFITIKTIEFKTVYKRATASKAVVILEHQGKVETKLVTRNRVTTKYVRRKQDDKK